MDADSIGALFPIRDSARAAKGRRWLRALQRQVSDVWEATTETDTGLCRTHGMETESEVVAISAAFAATAVRVIDLEVLCAEYSGDYGVTRDGDSDGRVVTGLHLVRNAEIHLPVILDPEIGQVLSLVEGTRSLYRVIPAWRRYSDLPREVQENRKGHSKQATRDAAHTAYKDRLEGRLVIETLLDAIRWFLRCDPSLASRGADGELEFFPLRELFQHRYERRHPEWPSQDEVQDEFRQRALERPPTGLRRRILHRLVDSAGTVEAYVGETELGNGRRHVFMETPAQIGRDIAAGYEYLLGRDGPAVACRAGEADLWAGADPLDQCCPVPAEIDVGDRWRALWNQQGRHTDLYVRSRGAT